MGIRTGAGRRESQRGREKVSHPRMGEKKQVRRAKRPKIIKPGGKRTVLIENERTMKKKVEDKSRERFDRFGKQEQVS